MNQKIKKLFQFLKSFNRLKTRPQLDLNSYQKVLWLDQVPREKECFSVTHHVSASFSNNSNRSDLDKWIRIEKPKRKPCPPVPNQLKNWLKKNPNTQLNTQANKEPTLFDYIIQESNIIQKSNLEPKTDDKKIYLKDHVEIKKTFENYLNNKWRPWAKEENRLSSVLEFYNELYNIYQKNKFQSETYEIVLGVGFLTSSSEKGVIKRHIVTTPAIIEFAQVSGTITVKPAEQGPEFSLEMDMIQASKEPKNSDDINNQLSELNNFWTDDSFHNNLKAWLNSYDPNGQFLKIFNKPSSVNSFTTLSISPALILRKRNERAFIKFYDEILKNIEHTENIEDVDFLNRPCLKSLFYKDNNLSSKLQDQQSSPLDKKYYFPLPANMEQKKIIEKTLAHHLVLVQGPPGTGKTHSIANLISHFLSKGKKILVTSQKEHALKVLKSKLPKKIQPLCVEIMGGDHKSHRELKKSFETINYNYQNQDNHTPEDIAKLEKKDEQLKGQIATIKSKLLELRNSETTQYEKQFGYYNGIPSTIASQVKKHEKDYQWIQPLLNIKSSDQCPVSNREIADLLYIIKKLQDMDYSVLEEEINFLDHILSLEDFKEQINKETKAKRTIQKYTKHITKSINYYESLKKEPLNQLIELMVTLQSKIDGFGHCREQWVQHVLRDSLSNRFGAWKYLYNESQNLLDQHKSIFQSADQIKTIIVPKKLRYDFQMNKVLNKFFKKYKASDSVNWGLWGVFCSQTIRKLKKIKIDGNPISSYAQVQQLNHYVMAKQVLDRLNNLWKDQGVQTKTNDRNFTKNYHIFKDFLSTLEKGLSIHVLMKQIKDILSKNNIPSPLWNSESVITERGKMNLTLANKNIMEVQFCFEDLISALKPYRDQKNQLANDIIFAYQNRDFVKYQKALNRLNDFRIKKGDFNHLLKIKDRLNNHLLFQALKEKSGNALWENRFRKFEQAWAYNKTDQWLKKLSNEDYEQQLNQQMKDLKKNQKQNMEHLVSKKAWFYCLSHITDQHLRSLKGLIKNIQKIGRGTGKSAQRLRKEAKKRMEECKTAIPAWVMPLYRVVENIKPNTKPFDMVIIDEASQIGPEGFLLTYLARQIIIVGDSEQISPESLGVNAEDVEVRKKKYLSDMELSEYIGREYSFYDFFEIQLVKSCIQLREHFRCMPEIIKFSNQISYPGKPLIPLRQFGSNRLPPLKTTFVPSAISKVGSSKDPQNKKEAQAIVDQIQKCIKDPAYKAKTFGIISLQGTSQVQVIEKALLVIDKKDLEERAIHVGNAYSFQGDERDVIFLSMGVAKDWKLKALTKETYKKIYNVAGSRARDQMWLFHSVEESDLSPHGFRKMLLTHCKGYKEVMTTWPQADLQNLYQKIKEVKNKHHDNAPKPFDSWFEARVFHQMAIRGYTVIPQYNISGYRIDMVIIGSNSRLAVECDGDYFHSGKQKEAEDMARQWDLERCGWTFYRLKASVFYRNPDQALKSLWGLLDKMHIYPIGQAITQKTVSKKVA